MPPRLPTREDFKPANITFDIVAPPLNQPPTNILILLHGLGDDQVPFSNMARSMALPETACVSIRGPGPMPFDIPGFHWGDDIVFNQATGEIDLDSEFRKNSKLLNESIIKEILMDKCGYNARNIVLFGFGQGGMLALEIIHKSEHELGGAISIGSGMSNDSRTNEVSMSKCKSPILVCRGQERSNVKDEDEDQLKQYFEFVQLVEWKRSGDGMPRNRDEMLPIMQFFARRLRSIRGVPAGSVELA